MSDQWIFFAASGDPASGGVARQQKAEMRPAVWLVWAK